MKILNEKEHKFVDMEIEISSEDYNNLITYFDNNCTTINDLKINWSINDILYKHIKGEGFNEFEATD